MEMGGVGGPSWIDATPPGRLSGSSALGPACGGLDVQEGVRQFVERAAAGGDDLRLQAHRAATSAISSLPWLTLRRALPEVADLFDAELARAEDRMAEASGHCERELAAAQHSSADGTGWQMAAKAQAWQAAGRLAATPDEAQRMSSDAAEQGILWLDGQRRGGRGQPPVRVIVDAVAEAAELLLENRPQGMISLWDSPSQAAQWLVRVVGDVEIHLEEQGASSAGGGLWLEVAGRQKEVLVLLQQAVDTSRRGESAADLLAGLHSERFGLYPPMLEALSRVPSGWRRRTVVRMAYELAMVSTLDRALLARQLLLTAMQLPEVAALPPARTVIAERLSRLERDIESLLFEYRARQSMGDTMSHIWRAAQP